MNKRFDYYCCLLRTSHLNAIQKIAKNKKNKIMPSNMTMK